MGSDQTPRSLGLGGNDEVVLTVTSAQAAAIAALIGRSDAYEPGLEDVEARLLALVSEGEHSPSSAALVFAAAESVFALRPSRKRRMSPMRRRPWSTRWSRRP